MKKTIFAILVLWVVSFGFVPATHAQNWFGESYRQLSHAGSGAGYTEEVDPRLIVSNIVRLLLSLVGTILFVLIAYAGFRWMTAQGNEEQIAEARKTITNSTIGLLVILSAYGITILITNLALGKSLGSWAV
jgi:hypothetical protein